MSAASGMGVRVYTSLASSRASRPLVFNAGIIHPAGSLADYHVGGGEMASLYTFIRLL